MSPGNRKIKAEQNSVSGVVSHKFHEDPDVNPQNLFYNIHIYKRKKVNQCILLRELDILPSQYLT